jgi:hypothetical protein
MNPFAFLFRLVIPVAVASNIEKLGQGAPGISEMWGSIKSTFPHTNIGGGGVTFIALRISNIILQMVGGIAVAVLVYGGIRMVMSRGNDEGFNEAKKIVIYTVIGLILVIGSDAIINYAMALIRQGAR